MSQLNLQVTPGFGGAGNFDGQWETLPYWVSVTTDEGKPAKGLSALFRLHGLQKPPNGQDPILSFDYVPEQYTGFYEATIVPPEGSVWRKGTYVLGLIVSQPTLGSFYPPKILSGNNGQALIRIQI